MNASNLILVAAPALALMLLSAGCVTDVTDAGNEQTVTPTRSLGERCWTSGAPPCAPGLACLPDPAFADIPGEPDSNVKPGATARFVITESASDASGHDPFAGDPGARPWICQPSS